jgi:hypothetical protein
LPDLCSEPRGEHRLWYFFGTSGARASTIRSPITPQPANVCLPSWTGFVDIGWGDPVLLNSFVIQTRTSQKIINTSGRKAGTSHTFNPRKEAGNTFCWPRKNDPVAMNSPRHMRQRCRTMRCEPKKTAPRQSMRTSPAADNSATEPQIKYKAGGYPSFRPVGLCAACKPSVAA